MTEVGRRWAESAWPAILILIGLAAGPYLAALSAPFVLDDVPIISRNRFVTENRTGDILTSGYWAGFDPESSERQALYRPLTVLTYAWNHAVGGLEVEGYRAVNIVLHVLITLLLYAFLRPDLRGPPAFFAAALFAVHPVHTEAVTYISGRADLLAALGFLGAWLLHDRGAAMTGRARRVRELGAAGCFAIGMLGKEMAATLPFVLIAADFLRGGIESQSLRGGWQRLRERWTSYALLMVTLGAVLALRFAMIGALAPESGSIALLDNPLRDLGFFARLDDGVSLLGRQIGLFLWPARLSLDYSFDQIPVDEPARLGWSLVTLGALLVGALAVWRRNVWVAVGIVTWFLAVAPVSNIPVIIGTILGERTLYLPSLGLALVVAGVLERTCRTPGLNFAPLILSGLIIGALGWRTIDRNADYTTAYRLWQATTTSCPRAARAAYNFAIESETRSTQLRARGDSVAADEELGRALVAFERAVEIYPAYLDARYALARQQLFAGQVDAARESFLEILASGAQASTLPDVLMGLADAYVALGRAREGLTEVTRWTERRGDLGVAATLARGLLAAAAGEDAIARRELETALAGPEPRNLVERRQRARAHGELALVLERAGEIAEARQQLDEAARIEIDLVGPFLYQVGFLLRRGELEEAGRALDEGFRRFPEDPLLKVRQARWQMARGDQAEAERTLIDALAQRPGDASALGALADWAQGHLDRALQGASDEEPVVAALDAAIRGFDRAVAESFERPGLQYQLALALTRRGQWRRAAEQFEAIAGRRGPRAGLFEAMAGERWLHLGEHAKAKSAFERASHQEGSKAPGLLGRARCALPKDPDAAKRHLERTELGPDDGDRAWVEIRVAEARGDRLAWRRAWESFREAHPEDPRGDLEEARWLLAARPSKASAAREAAQAALGKCRPGDDAFWQAQEGLREAARIEGDDRALGAANDALARWAPER